MLKKIVFFYGPKYNFRRRLPRNKPLTTISELAIYSDKKMREHTFKIQGKRGGDAAEKQEERLAVPCLVAYSEQYASISESALHSFLSFIDQFEVESLYLQNPPAHLAAQFRNMHSRVKVIKHEYKTLNFESLKRIDREYQLAIIGQEEVKRRLLTALYPLAAKKLSKPLVLLFYGPTGVGKSETAKYISDVVGQKLFRRQFSMFHSNEFAPYLFGGRHTGDSLAKDLMERESSVILFDEFDKPNPLFHSAFYQLFDEGIYEDRNYRAEVKNAVIICTSNYASAEEARERLGAPLFARFDAVIEFRPLSDEALGVILAKSCREEAELLTAEEREIISEEELCASLRPHVAAGGGGVRGVKRLVREKISEALLDRALRG
ncbi:AAA family ATPase [Cloacibacillus evryensis]|uniref:AAA family ATPase n=1 Tax=Cloacibacillus evryensis TaxID=508460 RepID=UPI00241E5390|nr:AAA family ATPase [Cloacibacillus evryensis]